MSVDSANDDDSSSLSSPSEELLLSGSRAPTSWTLSGAGVYESTSTCCGANLAAYDSARANANVEAL